MHHIAITNMTGARNRGCEALVTSILLGLEGVFPRGDLSIDLHSRDADHDRDVFAGRVDKVLRERTRQRIDTWAPEWQRSLYGLLARGPRRLAKRRISPSLAAADLIIATGGDVFTSDYGDVMTHGHILQLGRPVALLAQTIGPFNPAAEQYFKRSMDNVALLTVRESESLQYLQALLPGFPVEQTADVAFLLPITPPEQARHILEVEHHFPIDGRRLIALSVSSGILSFRADVDAAAYVREVAAFIDGLNADGFSVILIPHVQERRAKNNDIFACRSVLNACQDPRANLLLSLPTLTAADYKGVIGLCEALAGARTHATIGSMSQGLPTVSIAYSRKAWGIMRDYYGPALGEALTVDIAALDRHRLREALDKALANGRTPETAAEMKRLAAVNFERIRGFLEKA